MDNKDLQIIIITRADYLWEIIDEIDDAYLKKKYDIDFNLLLEAYKYDKLYGLIINQSNNLYNDSMFCKNIKNLLPCFCIKENNALLTIWSHPRIKKFHFEKYMINELFVKKIKDELEDNLIPKKKYFDCLFKYFLKNI
jgi:hypothetical protein